MKINAQTFKIVLALVVILVAIYWVVDSTRQQSYSGASLDFVVGRGSIAVTNPSDVPVLAQLTSTSTRAFTVSSQLESLAVSSERQEVDPGEDIRQLVQFELPPGLTEFTISSNSSTIPTVNFISNPDTRLEATSQPLSESEARGTLIVAVVVILGSLFYMSNATGHSWFRNLIGSLRPAPATVAPVPAATSETYRPYGDNTSN